MPSQVKNRRYAARRLTLSILSIYYESLPVKHQSREALGLDGQDV